MQKIIEFQLAHLVFLGFYFVPNFSRSLVLVLMYKFVTGKAIYPIPSCQYIELFDIYQNVNTKNER